jgi:hypothetical protein
MLQHAVLRVCIRTVREIYMLTSGYSPVTLTKHWYLSSSLPEDLRKAILDRYKHESPNAAAPPHCADHDVYDTFWTLQGEVSLHRMLNWIAESGWTLTHTTGNGMMMMTQGMGVSGMTDDRGPCHYESYLFTKATEVEQRANKVFTEEASASASVLTRQGSSYSYLGQDGVYEMEKSGDKYLRK